MFGSVDDITAVTRLLKKMEVSFRLHIDAAFGGFIYPFTNKDSVFNFQNPDITSITIDAHKMLQSPYGTGIFLIRKGFMKYVCTDEAQYIPGKDYTLCGSRSGANAVAIWMILHIHGSEGWTKKMRELQLQTNEFCRELDSLNIQYFRNPYLNIIAIRSKYVPKFLAEKYHLVADSYEHEPEWYKIVVMPHVNRYFLDSFFTELKGQQHQIIENEKFDNLHLARVVIRNQCSLCFLLLLLFLQ
jgi:glutamate/tyrosine decarboxylase-like PLP-dependent enzyme